MTTTATPTRTCPGCGSTTVGLFAACPRCATPIHAALPAATNTRSRLRGALAFLTLIAGFTAAGISVWQLVKQDPQPAASTPAPIAAITVPTRASAATTAPASASTTQSCTARSGGYTAHYPKSWVTASATSAQACHFFGAHPFHVSASDTSGGDVTIDTSTQGAYTRFVASFAEPGDAAIKIHHKPVTINGHRGQQMNVTIQEGRRVQYAYGYVIDHDNRPLIVGSATRNAPSPELQQAVTRIAYGLELR